MFLRAWQPVHPLDDDTTRLLEDFVGTRGKKHAGITLHVARFLKKAFVAHNFMLSSTLIGVELHWLGLKFNFGQVEVQQVEAELNFNLTKIELSGVARGHPPQTPIKSIEDELKSNEAKPSWTSTWPRWTWLKLHEVD